MIKVSFVVNVFNQANFVEPVIESLKKLSGDFRKEFIIVNDGSTDDSLSAIKAFSSDLPNTTIISKDKRGPSTFINEGILLASGSHIKFLDGASIIDPKGFEYLLELMEKNHQKVAFGLDASYSFNDQNLLTQNVNSMLYANLNDKYEASQNLYSNFVTTLNLNARTTSYQKDNNSGHVRTRIIDSPLLELSKSSKIGLVGDPTSMISRGLLDEISKFDNEIYQRTFSLSLRCASKAKFIQAKKIICYRPSIAKNVTKTSKVPEYIEFLLAVKNLISFDTEYVRRNIHDIYKLVASRCWYVDKRKYLELLYYNTKTFYKNQDPIKDLKQFIDYSINSKNQIN
ncbi:MAG: glycosyltransferase [Rickettsiaceae bacterium]|nr:glycosyltransferase [Rickettsiaceae bacterium]